MRLRKALLLAVLVPSLSYAQRAGTIELGAFGHYSLLDNDVQLGKKSFGLGGRLGFFAMRYLSLEAEYSFGTLEDNPRDASMWTPFRGLVVGHMSLNSSTRFLLGMGYKQDKWVGDTTDNRYEDGFSVLAGFRKCFGNKLSVRPEMVFDWNPSPNFQTPVTEQSRHFGFRLGISKFFGRGSGTCGGSPEPPVSVSLAANPSAVPAGGQSTLTWTSNNARSCEAIRPSNWTTKRDASGNETVTVNAQTTYWIMCRGPGGRDSASATVGIGSPTATLSANPGTITTGGQSTLTWSSQYATACRAQTPAGWTSSTATSGSQTVSPTQTTTYTIVCTNGSAQSPPASATVTVRPPVPTVNLTGGTTISSGESATLSWTSTNATSCATQSPPNWAGSSGTTGSRSVSPSSTTTYTIQCTGAGGTSNTASQTVSVNPRINLSIYGSALFQFDSSTVDRSKISDPVVLQTLDSLDMAATAINGAPSAPNIVIVGNTDYMGSNAYNDALSERRARNVWSYISGRVNDKSKLASAVVWACGERNANQTPPRPPEAEKGRRADRNVKVHINRPESVQANRCRQITP